MFKRFLTGLSATSVILAGLAAAPTVADEMPLPTPTLDSHTVTFDYYPESDGCVVDDWFMNTEGLQATPDDQFVLALFVDGNREAQSSFMTGGSSGSSGTLEVRDEPYQVVSVLAYESDYHPGYESEYLSRVDVEFVCGPDLNEEEPPVDPPAEPPVDPPAEPTVAIDRLDGMDRYETAVEIARQYDNPSTVFVATGQKFPDALATACFAARLNAPVLLVKQDAVPQATEEYLGRPSIERIHVLGGTDAVSAKTVAALGQFAPVTPIFGADRYETAVEVYRHCTDGSADTVFLANGQLDYTSALMAAPYGPVLLTKADRLPNVTLSALREITPQRVVIIGGNNLVSTGVEAALRELVPTTRVAGGTPYQTAVNLSKQYNVNSSEEMAFIATETDYADALAGGAPAALNGAPLFLAPAGHLPDSQLIDELRRLGVTELFVLGGPDAVSDDIMAELQSGLNGAPYPSGG